ncbi:MAG: hypothetical protein IJ911_12690 [Salinivirgaceae bacterium]|nr:hypothetical protein [Salinivirgaceae bacterium]
MLANPYIYRHIRNCRSPKIVETTADGNMYVGDCLPNCVGYDDKKWLIKLIVTDPATGLQQILFANGSTAYNQAWSDRKSLKYTLAPDFGYDLRPADSDNDIPRGALVTNDGVYIKTSDNQYIIVI